MENAERKSRALLFFGTYLIAAGLAGYLSNPEKAATALISGGLFGALSIGCGLLLRRGISFAAKLGIGLCALLTFTFAWRSAVGWTAVVNGNSEKLFAACLITSMLIGALATIRVLLKRAH